jgi:hypothetical protein
MEWVVREAAASNSEGVAQVERPHGRISNFKFQISNLRPEKAGSGARVARFFLLFPKFEI